MERVCRYLAGGASRRRSVVLLSRHGHLLVEGVRSLTTSDRVRTRDRRRGWAWERSWNRWHRRCRRRCSASRQLLTCSGSGLLRSDILRTFVVRRVLIIKCFQLELQLPLAFTSSFDLGPLSSQLGLLLLLFFLCASSTLLLFCFLELALLYLLFQCLESCLCSLTLFSQLLFLSAFFLPSRLSVIFFLLMLCSTYSMRLVSAS